jgi:hypothetical protein
MKIISIHVLCLILCISIQGQSLSPELVSSSGIFFQGTSGTLSYSIGECIVGDLSNSKASLSQGFHQNIEVIPGIKSKEDETEITVFPVPAENSLTLTTGNQFMDISVFLIDVKGCTIWQQLITTSETQIDLTNMPAGNYILHLRSESGTIFQSFKIVKQ